MFIIVTKPNQFFLGSKAAELYDSSLSRKFVFVSSAFSSVSVFLDVLRVFDERYIRKHDSVFVFDTLESIFSEGVLVGSKEPVFLADDRCSVNVLLKKAGVKYFIFEEGTATYGYPLLRFSPNPLSFLKWSIISLFSDARNKIGSSPACLGVFYVVSGLSSFIEIPDRKKYLIGPICKIYSESVIDDFFPIVECELKSVMQRIDNRDRAYLYLGGWLNVPGFIESMSELGSHCLIYKGHPHSNIGLSSSDAVDLSGLSWMPAELLLLCLQRLFSRVTIRHISSSVPIYFSDSLFFDFEDFGVSHSPFRSHLSKLCDSLEVCESDD